MHLHEILRDRGVPAAGIYLSMTRACPLLCEHCSTNSSITTSERPNSKDLIRFVKSFKDCIPPKVLCLTGGEPFLLPNLIQSLCDESHNANTKVMCSTGMFFAREKEIPKTLWKAIRKLDHLNVSIDIFHEKQIDRQKIFDVLHQICESGVDTSISSVGFGYNDPYLIDLVNSVRKEFKDSIPLLINSVKAIGRARTWYSDKQINPTNVSTNVFPFAIDGCKLATWPVVAFDGTIVACCNQNVVDGPHPSHLRLGHIKDSDWEDVRRKALEDTTLKAVRIIGPVQLTKSSKTLSNYCNGYCDTCIQMNNVNDLITKIRPWMKRPMMNLIEYYIQLSYIDNPPFCLPEYSDLIYLGSVAP